MLLVCVFVFACSENVDGENEAESGSDAIKAKDVDKRMVGRWTNERFLKRMNCVVYEDFVAITSSLTWSSYRNSCSLMFGWIVRRSNGLLLCCDGAPVATAHPTDPIIL